ncbi:hypothetical protein IXZ18_00815 [Campylobacter fetus subsp. venerealis bv. intermedius]|uniref:hypothetical protein n=1 Tax=Campylobacter fetus TaxID=196 RepID=UPI0026DEBAB0|nr:hypothetical protein [Campylobacter fetus]WKW29286.1 hypothetical protein IXZ18_00815 [Campylobacter fetus subsp. venerealis bv. intermedius]
MLAKEHEHIDIVTRKKEATENGFHFSIPNFFGKNGASLSSLNFKITEEEYSEEEDNLIRAMMALKHGKIFTRKKDGEEWIPYLAGFYFDKKGLGCYFHGEWVGFDNLYFKIMGENYNEAKDTLIRALVTVQYYEILTRKRGSHKKWIGLYGMLRYYSKKWGGFNNMEFKSRYGKYNKEESSIIKALLAARYEELATRKKGTYGKWAPFYSDMGFNEEMKRVRNLEFKIYDKERTRK